MEEEWADLQKVLPKKHKLLFSVLKGGGLRIQELLHLEVKDIVYDGENKGDIFVKESKGG